MILTGSEIQKEYNNGNIIIKPFNKQQLNPNSYNYRLGEKIKKYDFQTGKFIEIQIPEEGIILDEGVMYLGTTYEILGSTKYAMSLIGRSSIGRLGLFVQVSANLGHTGSIHSWTLELVASKKIRIYPKMKIGQISFWENSGNDFPEYQGYYASFSNPTESVLLNNFIS